MSIENLENKEENIEEEIQSLIDNIVTNKKYVFSKSDLLFQIDNLLKNDILVQKDDNYIIGSNEIFFMEVCKNFNGIFNYAMSDDVNKALEFIEKIENFLKIDGYNKGAADFFTKLTSYIVKQLHEKFDCDFYDFIMSLEKSKSKNMFYRFKNAFVSILPTVNIDTDKLFKELYYLIEQTHDNTVHYNIDSGMISEGIRELSKINPKQGLKMMEYSFEENGELIDSIKIPVLLGLYEKDKSYIDKIKLFASDPNHFTTVIRVLSLVNEASEDELKTYIEIIESIPKTSDAFSFNLSDFYVSLIRNTNCGNEIEEYAFNKLIELVKSSNLNLVHTTLTNISQIQNHDHQVAEIVISYIDSEYFDEGSISQIDHIFFSKKEILPFFSVLREYAIKSKTIPSSRLFELSVSHLRDIDAKTFDEEWIKSLIDNNGKIRYVSERILSQLIICGHILQFKKNILELDALSQYKLCLCFFIDIKEPKGFLHLLCPLFSTKYWFVKEFIICKTEALAESYGKSVLETLKLLFDMNNENLNEIYNRVNSHYEIFKESRNKRSSIKELSPLYTQFKWADKFQELFRKSLSQNMQQATDDNSIFTKLASKVVLAKGGGWKMEEKDEVRQLGKFESSFTLPRAYFIEPERFDWEKRKEINEDWTNKFTEWEAIISS